MPHRLADRTRRYGPAAIGGRLRRLSESIDEDASRIYADFGIEFQQRWVGVLEELSKRGPCSVGELAQMLGIRHASVSQTRRSLEESRLVQSTADPGDARSRRLSLTERGRQFVRQLEPVWNLLNATSVELDEEAGHVIAALDRLDAALSRRSLYHRVNERRTQADAPAAKSGRTPLKRRNRR
jgi:DNA-binding MarR family transcriptional regulator